MSFYISKKEINILQITKIQLIKALSYAGFEFEIETIEKIYGKITTISDELDNITIWELTVSIRPPTRSRASKTSTL